MKAACLAVPVSLLLALAAVAATVPEGSQLSISFRYRDNLNKLRNKGPGYAIQEDGYAQTIWVEGPHHPDSACTIARFERQNIKLVKVITYFAYGHNRANDDAVPNPWSRVDYNTPDFVAALISAGMYRYCPWSRTEGQSCTNGRVAPKDARRQDPTRGGMWRDKASVVCYPVNPARGHYAPLGDISAVTDGVSSATMYPGSTVTFTSVLAA